MASEDRSNASERDPGEAAALRENASQWARHDPDPHNRETLQRLLSDDDLESLGRLFDGGLAFGTSGLRAALGPGPRRMNRLVARQVASGLIAHLRSHDSQAKPLVLIGRDARHGSEAMAADMAAVVAASRARAVAFSHPVPTPLLAFAITELGADAAVMVTASHNPPTDNGVKIYMSDGAQPVAPEDVALAEKIRSASFTEPTPTELAAASVEPAEESLTVAYLHHLAAVAGSGAQPGKLVHTALHGVGWQTLARAFEQAAMAPPVPVSSQSEPDGDFPTVPYPNPEEPGALREAISVARSIGASAILANDPDADRLAVAVPARDEGPEGRWQVLSGNELGWLLADYRLSATSADGDSRLVVTTFETSRLVARLAAQAGVTHLDVPTGFKWIARAAANRTDLRFVFGYEEAIGYAVSDSPRDKDGIATALVTARLLGQCEQRGETVWDRLDRIAERVGHHRTATRWARLADPQQVTSALSALRNDPPTHLGNDEVTEVADMARGQLGQPVEALVLTLGSGARLVVRPSGTEAKLKVYAEVVTAPGHAESGETAAGLAEALLTLATDRR